MNVKGIAFIHAKEAHEEGLGKEQWDKFFQKFKKDYPGFPDDVLASSNIPIDLYLSFMTELIKEFYNGDERVYWRFGSGAARSSLAEGGYFDVFTKHQKSPEKFIKFVLARIWNSYFDMGRQEFLLEGNILHARLLDLPKYHPYFELVSMGYIKGALDVIGIKAKDIKKIKSSAKETYYQYTLDF
ncbi:MAG: hypothetical protein ACFE9Z_07825 [Promethearchaeota archaeon]